MYPSTGWRGVVLLTVVALAVGLAANGVVEDQRRYAHELDRLVATQTAIATARFDVETVMTTAATEALCLTGADGAVVEVPDGDEIVYHAVAGSARPYLGLRLRTAGTLSGEALRTGAVLVCHDSESDPRTGRDACRRIGARSLLVVPLPHRDRPAGVLEVYSAAARAFGQDDARVLTALAATIGAAVARSELLATVSELATTDGLTSVANRRAW